MDRQHTRDQPQEADAIGSPHGHVEATLALLQQDPNALAGGHGPLVLGQARGDRHLLPRQLAAGADDEVREQRPLPGGPRQRSGGQRICLGKGREELQELHRAHRAGHRRDRVGVIQVPTRGDLGQQQVVPAQVDERLAVRLVVAQVRGDLADQAHPDVGVVLPRPPLADVVQQRTHEQQVRPVHPSGQGTGLHSGLQQVPVDGVPVDRVVLGRGAHDLPVRDQGGDHPGLVE